MKLGRLLLIGAAAYGVYHFVIKPRREEKVTEEHSNLAGAQYLETKAVLQGKGKFGGSRKNWL